MYIAQIYIKLNGFRRKYKIIDAKNIQIRIAVGVFHKLEIL